MTRQTNKPGRNEPIHYWQTASDMLSGLLLILLLVILLLLLYIIQIPQETGADSLPGSVSASASRSGSGDDEEAEGGEADDDRPDRDGGARSDGGAEETPADGGGGGDGYGGGTGKTAVYVMVTDEETGAAIKQAGIRFELYTRDGGLQFLNTYYPRRVEYRQYQTTSAGVFYLPEKIPAGQYYLHPLNVPEGYDAAGNLSFTADGARDWSAPLVVNVALSPSKNSIRVRMVDSSTGQPVSGGVYDVTAAEDILTRDGTLRYAAGQRVGQIRCDSSGYGESKALYLGEYTLTQSVIPRYYAADAEPLTVSVEQKKEGTEPPLHRIACQKTTVAVQVADELYPDAGLEGASFWLSWGDGSGGMRVSSGEGGQLVLTNLEKNTVYRLRQLTSAEGYTFPETDLVFRVSADGRIDEEAETACTVLNRLLRAEIQVVDRVLRRGLSGFRLALYTSQGQLVRRWESAAQAQELAGLAPGTYLLELDGDAGARRSIELEDTAAIQVIRVPVWTLPGVLLPALGLAALAGLFLLAGRLRRRRPGHPNGPEGSGASPEPPDEAP